MQGRGARGARAYLTSNRLAADHVPAVPALELARTRHHMVRMGSVLVDSCETVTFWPSSSGAGKLLLSSIWIV